MTTTRRPIAFAAALIVALFVIAAHFAARPAEAAIAGDAPAAVAVPEAPAAVDAQSAAPATLPAVVAAVPVPTPEPAQSLATAAAQSSPTVSGQPPAFSLGLVSFILLGLAASAVLARRPASPRRAICA